MLVVRQLSNGDSSHIKAMGLEQLVNPQIISPLEIIPTIVTCMIVLVLSQAELFYLSVSREIVDIESLYQRCSKVGMRGAICKPRACGVRSRQSSGN